MTPEMLKQKLELLAPGTKADVTDLTGTQDHFQVNITSPAFQNLMTFKQHKLVMDYMKKDIESGEIHALSIKTFVPN